jgi:hypothetical protein
LLLAAAELEWVAVQRLFRRRQPHLIEQLELALAQPVTVEAEMGAQRLGQLGTNSHRGSQRD